MSPIPMERERVNREMLELEGKNETITSICSWSTRCAKKRLERRW